MIHWKQNFESSNSVCKVKQIGLLLCGDPNLLITGMIADRIVAVTITKQVWLLFSYSKTIELYTCKLH